MQKQPCVFSQNSLQISWTQALKWFGFPYRQCLTYESSTDDFCNLRSYKCDMHSITAVLQTSNLGLFPGWWYVVESSLEMLGSRSESSYTRVLTKTENRHVALYFVANNCILLIVSVYIHFPLMKSLWGHNPTKSGRSVITYTSLFVF